MKPNKSRIKLWIKALRSGKFRRATGKLRGRGNRRCCLGVGCDVFAKATGRGRWQNEKSHAPFVVGNESSSSVLPVPVYLWFGLSDSNPYIYDEPSSGLVSDAARCNDDLRFSIKKIAASIQRKFITPNRKAK